MTEETIPIKKSIAQKINKYFKKEKQGNLILVGTAFLALAIIAGYSIGYQQGYERALIDFKIIVGTVIHV